jgi:hypothetical protein
MPLDYAGIKTLHASPEGGRINPFFHKYHPLSSSSISILRYQYVIDTVHGAAYERPFVTVDRLTTPAAYYIPYTGPSTVNTSQSQSHSEKIAPEEIMRRISGLRYYYINTVAGSHLVAHDHYEEPQQVADRAYRTLAGCSIARARREVIASDRQIHWVWFRKPGYRLTEEIVLRAASWVELNPGFRTHLWSSLGGPEELADFLADLSADLRAKYFSGAITVHYHEEFRDAVFSWLADNSAGKDVIETFMQVWESSERQDIVMKTDYTRNILLAKYGGIYTDFNDLLCLAPVEPLLQAHAGACIGVTDNLSANNASNYFMYAGVDCAEWGDIVRRQTATIVDVRAMIYEPGALDIGRQVMLNLLNGQTGLLPPDSGWRPDWPDARHITFKHLVFTLCLAAREITRHQDLYTFINRHSHGRMRDDFIGRAGALLSRPDIAGILRQVVAGEAWGRHWRHARTDMFLNPIMHRSNLPIYCREQEIPLFLHPHGYLLRYGSLLSYVGHLGDASSYGNEAQRKTTMLHLLGGV